jgi:folate-binding protein YgfZ
MYEILKDRTIIDLSGDDALNFLQNLTTNDIKANDYCYSYALNNNGRYLFDFFVFKQSDTKFLIDINKNQADLFQKHLVMYKLRARIGVEGTSQIYKVVYSKEKPQFPYIVYNQDPRYDRLGFRCIVDIKTDLTDGGIGIYLEDNYNYAITDGYEDLIYEKSIPIEYGAEELNAVSYTKGCYIGQELISRTKYQGVLRKKIFKLSFESLDDLSISKNDEIVANGKKIGVICSYYKNRAIGLVREEELAILLQPTITVQNQIAFMSLPSWRL